MSDERGFTLVEVLVAFFLLMVGMAGTALMLNTANATTAGTKAREQGIALQREVVEAARSIPYDQLTPASVVSAVQAKPGLNKQTDGDTRWNIRRGGVTYTVTLGACSVDDPSDGIGSHDASSFCATGTTTTTPERCRELLGLVASGQTSGVVADAGLDVGSCGIDLNADGTVDNLVEADAGVCLLCTPTSPPDSMPDDYKRIVTLVTWDRGTGGRYALQSATVPNPGSAAAIGIDTLTRAPATEPVTTGNSISFTATTPPSRSAKTVSWTLSGAARTGSTSSPWTWTWDLGTVETPRPDGFDGTYIVGARAFDANDIPGPPRSMTVVLNRRRPFAPTGFVAGRNDGAIEFEWTANQERDIEGYRVYQLADGTATLACDTLSPTPTRATSCRQLDGVDGSYYVVAVDKAADAPREGDPSPIDGVDVTTDPPPPEPPGNLTATRDAAGAVTLSWPASPSSDVEYRIYRAGQDYGDRYDRVAGTATSYTDPQAEPTSTYSITAVNGQLAESTIVGPVSAP
jgi:type II secretory pathway pseudopilin PulG